MLSTVRKVGNSRGVLIPAAFLASCNIEDQVDIRLQDGEIVIRPVKRQLRAGWFDATVDAAPLAHEAAEAETWDAATAADDREWVW